MKTSVIRYRVADFLREHPPFNSFSLEHLLDFSGSGRVIFHEDDIRVFQKGEPHAPDIWIIQQGRVEILAETPAGEQLRDVLGPGDILALRRASEAELHEDSARTATEVILYSFDADAFQSLVGMYPEAQRYIAAHLSAASSQTKALQAPGTRERLLNERERSSWVNAELPNESCRQRLVTCRPDLTIRNIAKLRSALRPEAVVVIAENAHPLGLVTDRELLALGHTFGSSSDAASQSVMNRQFETVRPGLSTGDYLLRMMSSRSDALITTADGTANSPVKGVVTDSELALNCGRNPILIMRAILAAETLDELSYLCERVEAFVIEELAGTTLVEWFWKMMGELSDMFTERVVNIAEAEMARAGRFIPEVPYCWLSFGDAGRQELLRPESTCFGLIYSDPLNAADDDAKRYFSTLAQKVGAKLNTIGAKKNQKPAASRQTAFCRSFSEWQRFYSDLIRDPILNSIYEAREFFDFRPVCGDQALGKLLGNSIQTNLIRDEAFIPVLANDTLASLPPLTLLQDFIIDADGRRKQSLDLEKTALNPIVDAARVFALAGGNISSSNTLRRLEFAAREQPLRASTFKDAGDGLCIASFQHLRTTFSKETDARGIHPMRLSRFDQRLLKAAFDSVRRLLELTATTYTDAARVV